MKAMPYSEGKMFLGVIVVNVLAFAATFFAALLIDSILDWSAGHEVERWRWLPVIIFAGLFTGGAMLSIWACRRNSN